MNFIKLALVFVLLPLHSFANGTRTQNILKDNSSLFDNIFRRQLFTLDNQVVTLGNILIAVIILVVGFKVSKYLRKLLKRKLFSIISWDSNSANLMSRVIDYFFMATVIIIALDVAKVPITIFTFIGGAFVVSIGLSSQHLINNFLSGLALIAESKIKIGDVIEYQEIIGRVTSIEARMIELRSQDNIQHFIPHSKLMQEQFSNWSYNNSIIRVATNIKIDQQDILSNEFEKIILNSVLQNRSVLTTPPPQMLLINFEDNILNYEVNFWINIKNSDRRMIISEVNNSIFNTLKSHHISLAIPSRKYVE